MSIILYILSSCLTEILLLAMKFPYISIIEVLVALESVVYILFVIGLKKASMSVLKKIYLRTIDLAISYISYCYFYQLFYNYRN